MYELQGKQMMAAFMTFILLRFGPIGLYKFGVKTTSNTHSEWDK